jgi:hypothetical protein
LLIALKPPRPKIIRRRVIRWGKNAINAINSEPWRDHIARLCNTTYFDLFIDLPDLAGWNVGFKRFDTAKNVTVSNLRILRRTITRCDAQAQPGHLGLGFIVCDRTNVVIVIADPSQRPIANWTIVLARIGSGFDRVRSLPVVAFSPVLHFR